MLKRFTTEQLRDSKQKELMVRVADGGWHFSYMGGGKDESVEDRVKYKIKSAAHQEYNNRATLSKVKKKIRNHEDILGRSTDFQIVPVDESYPVYLREHLEEYQYLMYPGSLREGSCPPACSFAGGSLVCVLCPAFGLVQQRTRFRSVQNAAGA